MPIFIGRGAPFSDGPFSICLPAMAAGRMSFLPTIRMALSSPGRRHSAPLSAASFVTLNPADSAFVKYEAIHSWALRFELFGSFAQGGLDLCSSRFQNFV